MIDLKTRAVAPFFPDARTFHNIYKLQILADNAPLIFLKYLPSIFKKGLCVIILKLRSGMYIFLLYSLTCAQWSKITELGYRCVTTVSFKITYVYNY